jgi:transcriptional regulator with XRE-family HTH domain
MRDDQAKSLGDFLKSRRERLTPENASRRSRTPGLRREEVAERTGIGVDWYIRLEQGRGGRPSRATIDGLARALKLNRTEVNHLRGLAASPERPPFSIETPSPALVRVVAALSQPAYLTGRRWDLVYVNPAASELFGACLREDGVAANLLAFVLTHPAGKELFGEGWEEHSRRMVAHFRVAYDAWSHDPSFAALVDQLRRDCPPFAVWWKTHDVREAPTGVKRMRHPKHGWRSYDYATFQCNEDAALKLTVHNPLPD